MAEPTTDEIEMTIRTCHCGKGCDYDRLVIFRREGTFYPITGTHCEDWAHHAELNPGTLSIEDAFTGARLWPEGSKQ